MARGEPDKRLYKPGQRRTARQRGTGKMSENRFAWVKTAISDFVLMRYLHDDPDQDETTPGPTVRLFIPRPGGRPLSLNLTALTEQELNELEKFFFLAFNTARPIIQRYDEEAKRAYEEGDDSYVRSYRPDATLIVRERSRREHGEGLRDRSEDASQRHGNDLDPDGGSGGGGLDLALAQPSDPFA